MADPRTPKQTPQQRLREASVGLYQAEQALDRADFGTPAYRKALAAFNRAKATVDSINAEIVAASQQNITAQAQSEIAKLQQDRQRLIDKGATEDDKRVTDIDKRIEGLQTRTRVRTKDATEPQDPAARNQYLEALRAQTAPYAARAAGATSVPTVTTPPRVTGTGGAAGVPRDTGAADAVSEDDAKRRVVWVNYMRQTFKTLENPRWRKEITDLLDQAKKNNWTEDTFMDALEGTRWWQIEFPSVRQFFLDSNDPRKRATFAESVEKQTDNAIATLEALGVRVNQIDPVTGKLMPQDEYDKRVNALVLEKMRRGMTDVQFQTYLARNVDVVFTGGGAIGSSLSRIKARAQQFGIDIDDDYGQQINSSILDRADARDEQWWYNEMQNQAAELYEPFAEGINQGRTLYDQTRLFRTQMAQTLELSPEEISWDDLMKYAIVTKEDGTRSKATLNDFTKAIRRDERWQYTQNARETYSDLATDLMRTFGIVG